MISIKQADNGYVAQNRFNVVVDKADNKEDLLTQLELAGIKVDEVNPFMNNYQHINDDMEDLMSVQLSETRFKNEDNCTENETDLNKVDIDSQKLLKLAKKQGLQDNPEFQRFYKSIRTIELKEAYSRQYEECPSCTRNEKAPCCQSGCELWKNLEERRKEAWSEDRAKGGIDPCRNCPSESVCVKFSQEVKVGRISQLTKKQLQGLSKISTQDRNIIIKQLTEPKIKTMKRRTRVSDIEISIENDSLTIESKAELKNADIDKISVDTDLTTCTEKLVNNVLDNIKDKANKIYKPYEKKAIKFDAEADKQKELEEIKNRLKDEIAGHRSSKTIQIREEKVINCSENIILALVDVSGRTKDGATGAILSRYRLRKEYMEHCSSVTKYYRDNLVGDVQVFRRYGKLVVLVYIDKDNIDIDSFRKTMKQLDVRLNQPLAMAWYQDISELKRFKSVLKLLDNDIVIYDPWSQSQQ